MRLSPALFNRHLRHMGQSVQWRRSIPCPCRAEHSGAAEPGCPLCNGVGWLWDPAVPAILGLAGMRTSQQWERSGQFQVGDVVVTIGSDSPVYRAGQYDRITMQSSSEPFSLQVDHTGTERLPFQPIVVDRVIWREPTENVGVLGSGELGSMELGQAFSSVPAEGAIAAVAANGAITWSVEPPIGAQYSLIGRRRPEYFLFADLPQDRAHHGGLALPRRVALRRFDAFDR